MKTILLFASIAVAGCTTANHTYAPDGSDAYAINCSSSYLSWGKCYEKAGEKCGPRGYEVVSKDGDSQSSFSGNQFGVYGGQTANRSLVVKCRN